MDISNYTINVTTLEVDFVNSSTKASVELLDPIVDGVMRQVATFALTFDKAYSSTTNPELLADIAEKLEAIPD